MAQRLGRSVRSVLARRRRLKIPNRHSQVVIWTREERVLLGTKPDAQVARMLGRSVTAVLQRRVRLHIPNYRGKNRAVEACSESDAEQAGGGSRWYAAYSCGVARVAVHNAS